MPECDDDDAEEPAQAHARIVRVRPRRLPEDYGTHPGRIGVRFRATSIRPLRGGGRIGRRRG
jgi:hypothetical protein